MEVRRATEKKSTTSDIESKQINELQWDNRGPDRSLPYFQHLDFMYNLPQRILNSCLNVSFVFISV